MSAILVADSDPRLVSFGLRLKAARLSAGKTQEQLADAAELHRVTVARAEAGKIDVPFTTLSRLAEALGISPSVLTDDAN